MVHRKVSQEGSTERESHGADRGGARGFLRAEKWAAPRRTEAEAPTLAKHKPSTKVKEGFVAGRGGGNQNQGKHKEGADDDGSRAPTEKSNLRESLPFREVEPRVFPFFSTSRQCEFREVAAHKREGTAPRRVVPRGRRRTTPRR